jgi:hypothetical protein
MMVYNGLMVTSGLMVVSDDPTSDNDIFNETSGR